MNSATIILWVIALTLIVLSWRQGSQKLSQGLISSWKITRQNALIILLAFLIVGFVDILAPTSLVEAWIGPDAGWTGIITAEFLGMLLPGGPYVVFPLIAVLAKSGASLAAVVTLVTSWSTQSLLTITFELPFMGWRFTAIRWLLGLGIPLAAGLLTMGIWG